MALSAIGIYPICNKIVSLTHNECVYYTVYTIWPRSLFVGDNNMCEFLRL